VHAFEPNPEAIRLFRERSWTPNVRLHEFAVSDTEETAAQFHQDTRKDMRGVASSLQVLKTLHDAGRIHTIEVPTITLDRFCSRQRVAPDLIKIDVEGNELKVFRGAHRTIDRYRPVLIFEFWETWWRLGVRMMFDFLKEHYDLVRLDDGVPVNDYYYHHSETGNVDIGCVPRPEMRTSPMVPGLLFAET